jgi:hypothetical protein
VEALDVLWLLTVLESYDTVALGGGRRTGAAAALLVDLAHARLGVLRSR